MDPSGNLAFIATCAIGAGGSVAFDYAWSRLVEKQAYTWKDAGTAAAIGCVGGPVAAKVAKPVVKVIKPVASKVAKPVAKTAQKVWNWGKSKVSPKAAPKATAVKPPPWVVGRIGEDAVRAVYDIGPKQSVSFRGKTLIPDGLKLRVLSEVKNVKLLGYSKQLQDYADYARLTGRRFDLYVRYETKITPKLQRLIEDYRIDVKHVIDYRS